MKLISPRRILISSGNSSIDVARSQRPKGVSRWASGSKAPLASQALFMVRNFKSQKAFPRRPGRCWRKITGAPRRKRTSQATTSNRGKSSSRANRAARRSAEFLIVKYRINKTSPLASRKQIANFYRITTQKSIAPHTRMAHNSITIYSTLLRQ